MLLSSWLLLAIAVLFLVVWGYIGWMKLREHHHLIHHNHNHHTTGHLLYTRKLGRHPNRGRES